MKFPKLQTMKYYLLELWLAWGRKPTHPQRITIHSHAIQYVIIRADYYPSQNLKKQASNSLFHTFNVVQFLGNYSTYVKFKTNLLHNTYICSLMLWHALALTVGQQIRPKHVRASVYQCKCCATNWFWISHILSQCHRKHSFCKTSNYQDSGLLGCHTLYW